MTDYIKFMEDYADFYEEVLEQEKKKLSALFSTDIKQIEEAMSNHQTAIKKIQVLEERRMAMLKNLGLEGKTLREIIATLENIDDKNSLRIIHIRLDRAIKGVSFYNKKSLDVARYQMTLYGAEQTANDNSHYYNAKGKTDNSRSGISILEVKA